MLWFRFKKYGWVPVNKEGWAVMIAYFLLLLLNTLRIFDTTTSISSLLFSLLFQTLFLTVLLSAICYLTGEKPSKLRKK